MRDKMTPEQAEKIVTAYENRTSKPKPEQRAAMISDLQNYDYKKCVDIAKQYVTQSKWFPSTSDAVPSPEPKKFRHNFQPGIMGKDGLKITKKAIERTKANG